MSAQSPAVQAGDRGTLALEHPSPRHRVKLEEVSEEPGLLTREDEPIVFVAPQPDGFVSQLLPRRRRPGDEVSAIVEQLHVQITGDAV